MEEPGTLLPLAATPGHEMPPGCRHQEVKPVIGVVENEAGRFGDLAVPSRTDEAEFAEDLKKECLATPASIGYSTGA
jgi:hypothetical protein